MVRTGSARIADRRQSAAGGLHQWEPHLVELLRGGGLRRDEPDDAEVFLSTAFGAAAAGGAAPGGFRGLLSGAGRHVRRPQYELCPRTLRVGLQGIHMAIRRRGRVAELPVERRDRRSATVHELHGYSLPERRRQQSSATATLGVFSDDRYLPAFGSG